MALLFAACSDGRPAPRKYTGPDDPCGDDCNGQLVSRDCATLNPTLFRAGVAYCTESCTVDTRDCVAVDPGACNPLDDESCPAGQVCVQVGTSITNGVCADDEPPPTCQNGTTRCTGNTLQRCSLGSWQTLEDCAASGESCGAATGGYACIPTAACTNGQSRCSGAVLQTCATGVWVTSEDCGATGGSCVSSGGGYICQAGGGACDYNGLTAGDVTPAVFDQLAATYYKTPTRFIVLEVLSTGGSEMLSIELYPELGAPAPGTPATIQLTGIQTGYDSCNVCVVGTRWVNGVERLFMPSAGTLELSAYPSDVGQTMTARLTSVVLREVTINQQTLATNNVTNGADWCLGPVTYTAPAERYGCVDEGLGACVDGSRFVRCTNNTLTPVSCAANQVCRESAARVASCTAPLSLSQCSAAEHWEWSVFTFYDNDVWRYHSLMSLGFSTGEAVFVENYPDEGGLTARGTVQLTGANTDPFNCSTCVYGGLEGYTFMARYGIAELTDVATSPGELFAANIRAIEMHEVDENLFEVPGGFTWCIGNTTLGNFTSRYPCLQGGPGDRSCVETRLAECNADSDYVLVQDCAASSKSCEPTGPGTAECSGALASD